MSAPILVHLMRHGEPEGAGRLLGWTDMPATSKGIAACTASAAGLRWEAVACSDLRRASACAEAIAGRAVARDRRWRELDFGDWDGLHAAEIDADALRHFHDDPDAAPPPNGERWSTLVARVAAALDDVAVPTLVVTHAGAIRAALAHLCGFTQRQTWAFDLPYAAVVSLNLWRAPDAFAQIVTLRAGSRS